MGLGALQSDTGDTNQAAFALDDGVGLRVVRANFVDERKFDWDLFNGYQELRVLTYSASANAIIRMLDDYSFETFECVFGYEGTLREIKNILAFQKVVVGDMRAAIMGLKDERHIRILEKVHAGQAHFRVLRKSIAHAKLYLLSNREGQTRVIIGSANLSEQAFSGTQSETLVIFDDDNAAWEHYSRMYDGIRNSASDEILLPEDRITQRRDRSLRYAHHVGRVWYGGHRNTSSRRISGIGAGPDRTNRKSGRGVGPPPVRSSPAGSPGQADDHTRNQTRN